MSSFTLTTTALFLPLSSLWASASLDSRFRQARDQSYGPQMFDSHGTRSTKPMLEQHKLQGPLSSTDSRNSHLTSGLPSPRHELHHGGIEDLEAQGLAGTRDFTRRELE